MKTEVDDFFEYAQKHLNDDVVNAEENLSLILKSHLLIEKLLDILLTSHIFKDDEQKELFDWLSFSFIKKIELIKHKNLLSEEMIIAIKNMNNIRNKFAHNLDLSFEEIEPLPSKFFLSCKAKEKIDKLKSKNVNKAYKIQLCYSVFYLLGKIRGESEKRLIRVESL